MTRGTDVKQFFAPLLTRHSDLALCGRLLLVKPVRRIVRGVYMGRTSPSGVADPCFTAQILASRLDPQHYATGRIVIRGTLMDWSKPETLDLYRDRIEAEWLPFVRGMDTYTRYDEALNDAFAAENGYEFEPRSRRDFHVLRAAAEGRFDDAIRICEFLEGPSYIAANHRLRGTVLDILEDLYPALLRRDRREVAAILHAWEAESVRNLKLERYVEKGPFAIEMGA